MKTNSSFPHPVLGINKGVSPDLLPDNMVCDNIKETVTDYVFSFTLKQENENILRYIKEGFAEYVCDVDCQKTLFRRKYSSSSPSFDVSIAKKDVFGHIDFSFYVLTTKMMPRYSNTFNSDYKDPVTGKFPTFALDTGAVLVAFSSFDYNVSIKYENKAVLVPFIQIVKGDDQLEHANFDLENDIINVELPVKQFELFSEYNKEDYRGLIYTSIIFNALIFAILNIDSHDNKDWADSIKYRVDTDPHFNGLSLEDKTDAVEIASILLTHPKLGDPYDMLFNSIKKIDSNND